MSPLLHVHDYALAEVDNSCVIQAPSSTTRLDDRVFVSFCHLVDGRVGAVLGEKRVLKRPARIGNSDG